MSDNIALQKYHIWINDQTPDNKEVSKINLHHIYFRIDTNKLHYHFVYARENKNCYINSNNCEVIALVFLNYFYRFIIILNYYLLIFVWKAFPFIVQFFHSLAIYGTPKSYKFERHMIYDYHENHVQNVPVFVNSV